MRYKKHTEKLFRAFDRAKLDFNTDLNYIDDCKTDFINFMEDFKKFRREEKIINEMLAGLPKSNSAILDIGDIQRVKET